MNGIVQHADCEGSITTESTLKEANVKLRQRRPARFAEDYEVWCEKWNV